MKELNLIAIDLAKNVMQVCQLNKKRQVISNKAMSPGTLKKRLANGEPGIVAMEACGSAHYWAKIAEKHGHAVMLISPRYVKPYRQGQKTDANDALAIAHAAMAPKTRQVPVKDADRLEFQAIHRIRDSLVTERTRISNQLRGLLYEFGFTIPKGFAKLKQRIPEILEDAENGLSIPFRQVIFSLYDDFNRCQARIAEMDQVIQEKIKTLPQVKELMKVEGIGPIGASLLYITLGDGSVFKNGRAASAYVGVTPKQHSSGGKVVMLGIGKRQNTALRSTLIQGALAVVKNAAKKQDKKSRWLQGLVERGGLMKAAVALANKNTRIAWALLAKGGSYDPNHVMSANDEQGALS